MIDHQSALTLSQEKSGLTQFRRSVMLDCSAQTAFAFCSSRAGFEAHFPHAVDRYVGTEQWNNGDAFAFRYRMFGLWLRWEGVIVSFEENRLFRDQMKVGTFKVFEHTHIFEEQPGSRPQTLYTDSIEFTLGFGSFLDRTIGRSMIGATFAKRHTMLAAALKGK